MAADDGRVVSNLATHPPTVAQAEVAAKPKVRVGGHGTLARDNFTDPLRRHSNVLSETVFGQAERLEKFLFKHLTGGDRQNSSHGVSFSDSRRSLQPWHRLLSKQSRFATAD